MMTDKQMEEKKKQLFELLSSLEWTCDTSHPDQEYIEKEFESVWSFVMKLVEEVEEELEEQHHFDSIEKDEWIEPY